MLVGDLVHFRAALSNGVSHDMILSPSTTPSASRRNSAANTPDNRSLASQDKDKKKRRWHWWPSSSSGSRPVVKSANCGAGMKLPMNVV